VATRDCIEVHEVSGVEIRNPRHADDRDRLVETVAASTEMATALPSVAFYGEGREGDVLSVLAPGLQRKAKESGAPRAVLYTAENNNHAAEILEEGLERLVGPAGADRPWQILNTVIGKMSGVVTGNDRIEEEGLAPLVDGISRAFLVEEFNRILVTRVRWEDFRRGIEVFEEKPDLLPFEEAKLYGHNATHALLGYLLRLRGQRFMAEAREDPDLLEMAASAFREESGGALCRKHAGVDPLFTEAGYGEYVDDLLDRMLNPHLRDSVERVTRDPRRKLGWDDRLVGTMRVAVQQGVEPARYAVGAAAAVAVLAEEEHKSVDDIFADIWHDADATEDERQQVRKLISEGQAKL
jgi:mannitol-1-phosphate 5-dehydrogenase